MTSRPRERFIVSYPGYVNRTLNIITENLRKAEQGQTNMQASFAWQYFKALGYEQPPANWNWTRFDFQATGVPGIPPRHSKPTPAATYGCTCERDCASCSQGWHFPCKYGCMFGEQVL